MANFALIGTAGYIAPRHLKAIADTGNRLVAATDPHDSVGILDRFFPDAAFFTEIERFDRHLEKLRRKDEDGRVKFVSICSPNYLHDAHIRLALRVKADALCEKPLVINPWNLDALEDLEHETGHRAWTILQLRVHPALTALKERLDAAGGGRKADIVLSYITRRGAWYHASWKGSEEKSGGLVMNIGVHFFDMLLWLFGAVESSTVHLRRPDKLAGALELERARVRWFLSVDAGDLPPEAAAKGASAFRSITVDGGEIEFTEGFTDLHTRVYERTLEGKGFGIRDARPSIELVHQIRRADLSTDRSLLHPYLTKA
jgi:UDP-N-acetyl-2-amino-2-deoxyglucuronate dehydrogenase